MSTTPPIPEILAPAGGREQFFAALNAGADAVYLGLQSFNARARAANFTPEDLHELVPLAHAYGMKVLVAVNIVIKEAELDDLVATLAALEEAEVDAIIVQDLGVARLARACFPGLRLHASTQMAIHNLAGVRQAQALGFRRVVLARELTALELRKIRAALAPGEVELEVFCHGSLCYSYSGLCFFSGAEDARSGNRGECAYTCRQPYEIVSEPGRGFLFSMRDLDTSDSLDLLIKAGVDTLKIEGRKKDAQYVASTVRLYRERLDQLFGFPTRRASAPQPVASAENREVPVEQDLALSFQRRPTSFFVKGRYHENVIDLDNPTHQGLPVGRVNRVRGRQVTLVAECTLERFDGLRILPGDRVDHQKRYENEHLEFSLRDLTVKGRRAYAAQIGDEVEIELPPDAPLPRPGDIVQKIRSADLKRHVSQLAVVPPDAKLRSVRVLAVHLEASPAGDRLRLIARAEKLGEPLASCELTVEQQKARGEATLTQDLTEAFAVLGNAGFAATEVHYTGEPDWFVPRSRIKQLKHELEQAVTAAYAPFLARRVERARRFALVEPVPFAPTAAVATRTFAVKTDRLETLRQVVAWREAHPDFPLGELIFEPKRAFLPELNPEALAATLLEIQAAAAVPLRLALPTVIRAWDEPLLARWLTVAVGQGLRHLELGNLGAFHLLQDWGLPRAELDLAADFTLYAFNSCTSRFWRELGIDRVCLSIEDDLGNLRDHLARLSLAERERTTAILYKDTPLFIAEACSLTALHQGCPTSKVCGYRTLEVKNPKGERFYVAHESCKSIVYGHEAYAITHKQAELAALGLSRFRLDFLTRPYDEQALDRVLGAALTGARLGATHVANFERTLL